MLANYAKYFLCGLSVLMLYGGFVNAAESDPVSPFLRGARGDRSPISSTSRTYVYTAAQRGEGSRKSFKVPLPAWERDLG